MCAEELQNKYPTVLEAAATPGEKMSKAQMVEAIVVFELNAQKQEHADLVARFNEKSKVFFNELSADPAKAKKHDDDGDDDDDEEDDGFGLAPAHFSGARWPVGLSLC